MRRDLRRSIRKSAGRYLAILAIIALGSGFLVGLRSTKGDMLATAQTYIDQQALFDLRVLNTYGYTQEAVEALGEQPGIGAAEGAISMDVLLGGEDWEEDAVFRLLSLPERINVPELQAGRMLFYPWRHWENPDAFPRESGGGWGETHGGGVYHCGPV